MTVKEQDVGSRGKGSPSISAHAFANTRRDERFSDELFPVRLQQAADSEDG